MTLILSKSSTEKRPAPVWFVVEREPYGAIAASVDNRLAALDQFTARLADAQEDGEGYTPWQRGRRLSVKGPDVHTRAEGDDAVLYVADDEIEDPPLIALAALHAVLSDDEYALYVQKPVASALLES